MRAQVKAFPVGYTAWQGLIQLLGLVTGILVVRALAKEDYAHYALTISMISTATLVADSGLSATILSRGAALIAERRSLRALLTAAAKFRFRLGSFVALAGGVLLAIQLAATGGTSVTSALLILAYVATFYTQGIVNVLLAGFRARRDTTTLRTSQVIGAVARLAIVGIVVVIGTPGAPALAATGLLGAAATFLILARAESQQGESSYGVEPGANGARASDRKLLGENFARVVPTTVALVVGEQFFLLAASVWGSAEIVAEVSAFARFGMLFVVLNALVADVFAPRLAHVEPVRRTLLREISKTLGIYLVFSAVAVTATALLAEPLLRLLGPEYEGLELPLVLMMGAYAAINLGHTLNTLVQARGWVHGWHIYIPLQLVWAASAVFVDFNDIVATTVYFGAQAIPYLTLQAVRIVQGTSRRGLEAREGRPS